MTSPGRRRDEQPGASASRVVADMARIGIEEHRAMARWAAGCAEHVLSVFAAVHPDDARPGAAVAAARAWAAGDLPVGRARSAAFAAHAAAREAPDPASAAAARAAGHAAATAHVPEHARHAAAAGVRALVRAAVVTDPAADTRGIAAAERAWQAEALPPALRPRQAQLVGGSGRGGDASEVARLFVALWPGRAAVAHLRAALDRGGAGRRPGSHDLRWQPPERWHITVAFLGDADPAPTTSALAGLRLPPADALRLTGSGTFGPVLWIGVEHGSWLTDLAEHVRTALGVADELFRAHVTVARGRGRTAIPLARATAPELAGYAGPAWTPEALTLVRSRTGPQPQYDVIATWPFPTG